MTTEDRPEGPAVAKVQLLVCDICGRSDDVEHVEIIIGDSGPVSVDLCPEHIEPVRLVAKSGSKPDPKPKRTRVPVERIEVTPRSALKHK
jgi:hypothetical protein